jgi:SpoVK/Ycf46/Vps4 family AAA+-type ATPase
VTSHPGIQPSLFDRVDELRQRVAAAVAAERALDVDPDDPYRGLYVADHHVDRVLLGPEPGHVPPRPDSRVGGPASLDLLARRGGLADVDVEVLVAALAPDLDPGFEKLYAYLNDDITRRRASVGLALRLAGVSPADASSRARLLAGAPLVDLRLVEVEDADRPFLTRGLRVPDRVLQHLLGHTLLPAEIAPLAITPADWPDEAEVRRLAGLFRDGCGLLHLNDPGEVGGADLAHAVLRAAGLEALCIDLARAPSPGLDPDPIVRELLLRGAGLVVAGAERADPDLLRALVERPAAVVAVSREAWDPRLAARTALCVRVRPASHRARRQVWSRALRGVGAEVDPAPLDAMRLSPTAIERSVAVAGSLAALDDVAVSLAHVRDGARLQASSRLGRLARRIRPRVSWEDLVVSPATRADIELLVLRIRHRERVLDEWGLRRRSGHAEGVTALFSGGSGTGKTLAAEAVAAELGLELYLIDLSTVVDKYVGETEKNLERVFAETEGVNGILFFDEADAIFGKRSEVSDARDRYANTEIAYLLQRIESFDGLAILATNLKANVDEAFLRRLAVVVDFPDPDVDMRRRLWRLHLGSVPCDADVDRDFLSDAFALSGGNIRNIAVTAAFMAAADDRAVRMSDLVRAVAAEYRKLGRLCDESEFGPWVDVLGEPWTEGSMRVA